MADYYFRSGEEVVGPLTGIELREAAFAGRVVLDTLVANSEQGPWSLALRVKGLFDERGRPLPHPPETEQLIADTRVAGKAVDPPPPPIQVPVRPVNSGPPARRRTQVSNHTHLSPVLVIAAVAIAGAAIIIAVVAMPKRQRPIPVAVRSTVAPVPSNDTDSRTRTETEYASSLEPNDRLSAADAPSRSPLASDAQARHSNDETTSAAASEMQDLEITERIKVPFDAPREFPIRDESASVLPPVRAESDDETEKPPDSESPKRDLPDLIADIGPSVVIVARSDSYGSGFVVGDGIIATNRHVQVDAERVRLVPLPVSTSLPRGGQFVFALGYPLWLTGEITPTDGIVSAKRSGDELCAFYDEPRGTFLGTWLQTTAAINHGNSGGPLLDMRGEVVGMSTLIGIRSGDRERADGINFGISCLDLVDALEIARTAAVTPLPEKSSPAVAVGGSAVDGSDSDSDWLQPVATSERFLWSLPAGSFYIDGDQELHQFTAAQSAWGRIVGFTIDSILVQFDNSKSIGYVRLVNLGTQIKVVGAHMRAAEADLRRDDAAVEADLLSERWKQSQRGMITHGAMQDGMNRQ
ncbi:MAG: trypsin-like peptidase domain-containing protein, partial [Planctomycetia bacterium]|nr:trypsin-like peptidase domain-containing protein [Planctomycetia bacterium]